MILVQALLLQFFGLHRPWHEILFGPFELKNKSTIILKRWLSTGIPFHSGLTSGVEFNVHFSGRFQFAVLTLLLVVPERPSSAIVRHCGLLRKTLGATLCAMWIVVIRPVAS